MQTELVYEASLFSTAAWPYLSEGKRLQIFLQVLLVCNPQHPKKHYVYMRSLTWAVPLAAGSAGVESWSTFCCCLATLLRKVSSWLGSGISALLTSST